MRNSQGIEIAEYVNGEAAISVAGKAIIFKGGLGMDLDDITPEMISLVHDYMVHIKEKRSSSSFADIWREAQSFSTH